MPIRTASSVTPGEGPVAADPADAVVVVPPPDSSPPLSSPDVQAASSSIARVRPPSMRRAVIDPPFYWTGRSQNDTPPRAGRYFQPPLQFGHGRPPRRVQGPAVHRPVHRRRRVAGGARGAPPRARGGRGGRHPGLAVPPPGG